MATEKRLIWGDIAEEHLMKLAEYYKGSFSGDAFERAANEIRELPTVDAVEVVHGRWEWLGPNRLVSECMCGTCSVCKVRSKYIVNTDICPNCGADMRGDGNGT